MKDKHTIPDSLTTNSGAPLPSNEHTLTSGERGPALLQDHFFIEKMAHFNRERIPERVVHAKGCGAFGFFEVTNDISAYTKAHFLGTVGKKTDILIRFSTVGGERGTSDFERDPRGFAVKFYTEEGNYDIVGNNLPVFFIRDPFKFPDMVHTHKRNPQSNLKDANAFWDFFSHSPESTHMVTMLFSDRGTPKTFRHMNGFGVHTFKFVNAQGQAYWIKWHFKPTVPVETYTAAQAAHAEPDGAVHDLFAHIQKGQTAEWKVYVQIMPLADSETYRYDPFDVTKVWLHKDYPLQPVGRLVLNRNPKNFFQDIEQAAFSPANFVPGIEASPDKLLQGRLFAYPDTQRHRLGPNFAQIPVNCPYAAKVHNHQRDGFMRMDGNGGSAPNYAPNSYDPHKAHSQYTEHPTMPHGLPTRGDAPQRADDFEQAGLLFRALKQDERANLIANIAGHMKGADVAIQQRQIEHFTKADKDYGALVKKALGL